LRDTHTHTHTHTHLDGRSSGQGLREADHAHVVGVLLQAAGVLVAAVQTREAGLLVLHPPTGVATGVALAAGQFGVLLRERPCGEHFYCTRGTLRCLICVWCGPALSEAAGRRLIHY